MSARSADTRPQDTLHPSPAPWDGAIAAQGAVSRPKPAAPRTDLPWLREFAERARRMSLAELLPRPAAAFALCLLALMLPALASAQSMVTAPNTVVGQTSSINSVNVGTPAGGVVARAVVFTNGVDSSTLPNPEFTITASNCQLNVLLIPGQGCSFTVNFAPQYPGWRTGALVLQAADGSPLGSVQLGGVASGSLPVMFPGLIQTVAGNGQWIYRGDGVAATSTSIFLPTGVAIDAAGNIFLSDSNNNRIRRVDAASGLITTIAGTGDAGYNGDHGPATQAALNTPAALALDGTGNLYVADAGNSVIRRIDALTGVITTVAGTPALPGYTGDGGPATAARLANPQGLAIDLSGNLLIADTGNSAVRRVALADGTITTVAGTGVAGYNGDFRTATTAQLNSPWSIAVRHDGAIAIADLANHRVRAVDTNGIITTIAGTGVRGLSGDGSAAVSAQLNGPAAVAFDPAGDLIIADSGNNRIRLVMTSPTNIMTISGGDSESFAGDGGPSTKATMYGPYALNFTAAGDLLFSDMFHNRIRRIYAAQLPISFPTMRVGKLSAPVAESIYNAGNAALTLIPATYNQSALDLTTTTCAYANPVLPSNSCNVAIEFAPTQVGDNITGTLGIPTDAPHVTPLYTLNGPVLSVEPTSTALTSSANPSLASTPITFTAMVSSADTNLSGTVDFYDGTVLLCRQMNLVKGTATCPVGTLGLGSHNITAAYSGNDNNANSTSPVLVEVIKQQPALALSASASPATVAQTITLTLSAAAASGTPTGTITFFDGAASLGTASLNGLGIAQISTSRLAVGTHPLTAQYSGDASNMNGTSNTVNEEIDQASTVTVLAASGSSITVGSTLTVSATVVSPNGPAPTGSITFKDGAASLGTVPLQNDGTASLPVAGLTPGNHSITAIYSGDGSDAGSNSSGLTVTVNQIATVTNLGADSSPVNAGATLHLTAIVAMAPGSTASGALTGTVTFKDGSTILGTADLNGSGQATFATSTLTVGSHMLTAVYGGATNYATSSSTTLNETVQTTQSAVAVLSSVQTVLAGMPAAFTVAVTSQTGVPTGRITMNEGATVLGSATVDAQGHAGFSTSTLPVGNHTLTFVYVGDSNYSGSNSPGVSLTVNLATATLALNGPTGTVDAGVMLTFSAALSSPGVAPTGTLTLLDGATVLGTQTVSAAGSFSFPVSTLGLGQHSLVARYGGDRNNAPATSAALNLTVQLAPTATAIGSSTNPVTVGNPVTLTATVTSDSPNPTGAITFAEAGTTLGTATLDANGHASVTLSSLPLGSHAINATYAGDAKHAASVSAALPQLVVAADTASLSSSVNPSVSGQGVTFAAAISGGNGFTPSGSVTFADNGQTIATVPLDSTGHASFSTATLAVGTHTIALSYPGDQHFAAANTQLTQTVTNASTRIGLTASANPATFGQPLALSATVSSNGGTATGNITFMDGSTTVGTATLDASGLAVLNTAKIAPGNHAIVANYAGDGKASASVSTPLAVQVQQSTTVALAANPNPAQTLAPVTLTATVTNAGATTPTGTVTFLEGQTLLGSASVDASGRATLTLPQMPAAKHSLTASYAGDVADFASVSGAITAEVDTRPTAVSLSGSSTNPANPQQVTLIAVVRASGGSASAAPSGAVTFTWGGITLGQANVDPTGVASLTVIFQDPTEKVIASYGGDASYTAASTAETAINAGQAAQFTLALDKNNLSLASKNRTVLNVAAASVAGFADTLEYGCIGLPYAATCTFSAPSQKLAANGTTTVQVIVDTGNPLGSGTGTTASLEGSHAVLALLPLAGLLAAVTRRRKGLRGVALGICLILGGLGAGTLITGCGGLQTSGTPPGTYTFNVVATGQGSGAVQQQTVTLVVTQ